MCAKGYENRRFTLAGGPHSFAGFRECHGQANPNSHSDCSDCDDLLSWILFFEAFAPGNQTRIL